MKKQTAEIILKSQIKKVFKNFDLLPLLNSNIETVIKSGAIDSESITADKHETARTIFLITIKQVLSQYEPQTEKGKVEKKNLECFI